MKLPFAGAATGPGISGGFIEAMCETLVALAIAAAICIGVISLSAHVNEARSARASAAGTLQEAAALRAPQQPRISDIQ